MREAARITPDDRLLVETDCPVSRARAAPRQTQRAGVRCRDRAQPGGGARRSTPEAIAELTTRNFRAAVFARMPATVKLVNLHEFRQAGAGPHRSGDLRPDPGRPGAGGEARSAVESVASVDAVTAIGQYLQSSGGKRLRPALLLLSAKLVGDGGPTRHPPGRRRGDDPRRHAGA